MRLPPLLIVTMLLTACGEGNDPPTTAEDETVTATGETVELVAGVEPDGATLYQDYCASCHEGGVFKAPHVVTFNMSRPEAILDAMNGVMAQQSEDLSSEQKVILAEYLSGATLGEASDALPVLMCSARASRFDVNAPAQLNGWGFAPGHTRFIDGEIADLTKDDIPNLRLKWAFAYPNATRARSQPTLAGGSVFMGSQDGTIYVLNEETGCARWTFSADAEVRSSPTVTTWEAGDRNTQPSLYFGDFKGNVYRLNARKGELIWKVNVNDHKNVTITGSPTLHDGILYVPMSSTEWASAADPGYACCTFRGGVVAFDAESGEQLWKTYTIADEPRLTGETNSDGTPTFHPAGAPVWNSPSIDAKRGRLYVGTGEAYTSPAADTSDAIIAMDLKTGEIIWTYQGTSGDAWNMACQLEARANCPVEDGPDFDFGASPILLALPTEEGEEGRDILLAGQKSGHVHALNPDSGELIWKKRTGLGGFAGGVHWGMAAHEGVVYVPNADTDFYGKWQGERKPGMWALDAATGDELWFTPNENVCPEELKPACDPGMSAAPTAFPGVVLAGGFDGWIHAYDMRTGEILREYNTVHEFPTVNGDTAQGGSFESDGPVVANGKVFLNSGYLYGGRMAGNVLIVFSTDVPEPKPAPAAPTPPAPATSTDAASDN